MEELQAVVERLGGAAELVGDRMGCPELTDDIRTLCDAVTLMGCGHPRMFWVTEAVAFDAIDAGYGYCSACRSQQDAVAAADKQLREADAMLWAMNKGVFRSGERIAELEAELTALRTRTEGLVLTTRDVMKLIDDGYLIRDISKDHERDWAIRQMKAVAVLTKWAQQTDELAAAISVGGRG